ncbi:NADPH-dependent FMN reductase [hydrothermal vent metagenome]|uniref:NADPH-dependent FMN reductase n=1 Tax=hydrothermal vent metagenome TaxID=652676 RepID=A0A3B0Z681_9ZZZZ
MNLLAISGSVREGSYNLALLHAMNKLCPKDASMTVYDQIKEIPIFDPDINDSNLPESVCSLITMMRKCDGVIISTPEYAHGVPGALKNTLDWLVSSDALILKPIVVTSVSTSGLGGVRSHSPLILILSAMNTNVVVEGSINIPYAKRKFDENMNLTDDLTKKAVEVSFLAMKQAIENA